MQKKKFVRETLIDRAGLLPGLSLSRRSSMEPIVIIITITIMIIIIIIIRIIRMIIMIIVL